MKVYLFPNLSKLNCREYTENACEVLKSCGISIMMEEKYRKDFPFVEGLEYSDEQSCISLCDAVIAIGGDGTILKCSVSASEHKKPVLGINCGRLGFMASLEHTQLDRLKNLADGKYSISRRMMLKARVKGDDNSEFFALNDVVVSRSDDCKIADFEVHKDGQPVSSLRANGVILSTATGATAYSMSAGGPIIEPEMECIEFTQICPHSLFARSMIFSSNSRIIVKCHTADNAHVCLNVDGNIVYKLSDGDEIEVMRSPSHLDIIDIDGGSFFSSVNRKLMRPLKDTSEENQ